MHALSLEKAPYPIITPNDRFALTLCLAIILHAMLVLGVSFAPEPPARLRAEGLEVTLVAQKAPTKPRDPDLLAQANAEGGGSSDIAARPAAPLVAPLPALTPEIAANTLPTPPIETSDIPLPLEPMMPAPAPQATPSAITQAAAKPTPLPETMVKPAVAKLQKATPEAPSMPAQPARHPPSTPATPTPATPAPATTPVTAPQDLPTAQQLITRSFAMASMHAELQQKLETKAKRPRTKFVSATTQEYKYASYMEAWRVKVERIGNLNYPDEARKHKLSGALLLNVSLKPDGSVLEIIVRRSSGHRVLDDAAIRIVELAGPFAPFPDDIRREVDILQVTRTWKFLSSATFRAR